MLDLNKDVYRVKYGDMEKIDGKKYHELKFEPTIEEKEFIVDS